MSVGAQVIPTMGCIPPKSHGWRESSGVIPTMGCIPPKSHGWRESSGVIPTTGCIPPKSHGWRESSGVVSGRKAGFFIIAQSLSLLEKKAGNPKRAPRIFRLFMKRLNTSGFPQFFGFIRFFPGQVDIRSSKMAIGGSLTENRPTQI